MSNYTGTNTEVLFSSIGTPTALASFTTEDNLQKTWPPVIIPAGFFLNLAAQGKSLKIKAWGRAGAAATLPTYTWSIRLLTSTTWSAGGILLGTSAGVVSVAATLAPWTLEADIKLRTLSIGGASTLETFGEVRSPKLIASPFMVTIPDNNTAFTSTTIDNSATYYLFLSCTNTGGTSQASNTVALESLKVYGEN
jgi:hypothetical protein